jgi:hypothetical protein
MEKSCPSEGCWSMAAGDDLYIAVTINLTPSILLEKNRMKLFSTYND